MKLEELTLDDIGALVEITSRGGKNWIEKLKNVFYPGVWEGELTALWWEGGLVMVSLDKGPIIEMSKDYYVELVDERVF